MYRAPTIINAFLESYDMSNKTIVVFATSGGSGFGETVTWLKGSVAENTVIEEGMVQKGRQDMEAWKTWAARLSI